MRLINRVASSRWPPSSRNCPQSPRRKLASPPSGAQDLLPRRRRRSNPPPPAQAARGGRTQLTEAAPTAADSAVVRVSPTCARNDAASGAPPPAHHIADQALLPGASSRAITAAAATPGCRSSTTSISPGNAKPAQLHLRVRPPESQHPVRPPARHPRCGTSGSPRRHAGPQQTAPQSAPRPRYPRASPAPDVQLPATPRLAASTVQYVHPVFEADARSARAAAGASLMPAVVSSDHRMGPWAGPAGVISRCNCRRPRAERQISKNTPCGAPRGCIGRHATDSSPLRSGGKMSGENPSHRRDPRRQAAAAPARCASPGDGKALDLLAAG
jgi:hypothetical protein